MIPLFKVFMSDDVHEPMKQVLSSGYIGQGSKVDELEKQLRELFGVDYLNTVNSCTSALQLAVHLIKTSGRKVTTSFKSSQSWDNDAEVITTPLTCTATNFAIMANQVKVRWADVDLNTGNIDLDDIERKLSPKTMTIMIVHWGGYPVDLDRLADIQRKCRSLYGHTPDIIEDCAHAWGSTYKSKLIGTSHHNYAAFSFQAIKHFTTGDGGMLITPNAEEHRRAKLLRWFGLDRESSADFRCAQNIKEFGFKYHMNDIAAVIGLANLKHTADLVKRHQENSAFLDTELASISGLTLLENKPDRKSAAWIYTMRVDRRDDFVRAMAAQKIHVSQVHARNDIHECLSEFRCSLPSMDQFDKEMICMPCGWWVSDEDRQHIVDSVKKGW